MSRLVRALALLTAGLLVSACQMFAAGTNEQTLVAQNNILGTDIAALRQTATVEADRLLVTLEGAQTAISHVGQQSTELVSTLIARGTPAADLNLGVAAMTPNAPVTLPTPAQIVQAGGTTPLPGVPTSVAVTPGGPGAASGSGGPAAPITLEAAGAVPALSNLVAASGVGSDDCALAPLTSFAAGIPEIWVVATANGIEPGTNIATRWTFGGQEVALFDFTPDYAIDGECIWFFATADDFAFAPGAYSVQFEINGGAVGAPVSFTIEGVPATEAAPVPADTMDEMTESF